MGVGVPPTPAASTITRSRQRCGADGSRDTGRPEHERSWQASSGGVVHIGSNLDGGSKLINAQLGIDRGDVHGVSRYLEINHIIAAGCARSGKMTANKVPSATDEVTAILPW